MPEQKEQTDFEKLQGFASSILERWPDGDVDGGDLQDLALAYGLLTPVTVTEMCGEGCRCAEYYSEQEMAEGVECLRLTDLARACHQPATQGEEG